MPRKGVVSWFDEIKGFGFIRDLESGEDIYVDYSSIIREGFRTLSEGERVEYTLSEDGGGKKAARTVPL